MKDAAAAIIVYDITQKYTFERVKKWVKELKNHGPSDIGTPILIKVMCVVGNKSDMIEKEAIPMSEAQKYSQELNSIFQLTSAKEGTGVNVLIALTKELFDKIAEVIVKKENVQRGNSGTKSGLAQQPTEKPKKDCEC